MTMADKVKFEAESNWFHVFKTMFDSLEVKEIGAHAFTLYCAVKSHVNFKDGEAFPSFDRLQEITGFSRATITKSLNTLEERNLVRKEKHGRKNIYTLREKVNIQDMEGRPEAVATWDYLPRTVQAAQAELKNFLLTGKHDGSVINIEYLNLQVNIGDYNNQQNIKHVEKWSDLTSDPKRKELLDRIQKKRQSQKQDD
jgi:DNA-binding transcriptional regulator YhcF (GntR family)